LNQPEASVERTMNNRARAAAARPTTPPAAFTLMEVLVAVAALAILAVGVAAIFDTTGKTVTTGRRVSNFNATAAMIEQQLRHDIESMTREGFLVIRNQYAAAGPSAAPYGVRLHEEDTSIGRSRRVDELMFFSRGKFRSARELFFPDIIAESDSARIYYGHGMRLRYDPTPSGRYLRPEISESHEGAAGFGNYILGNDIADNPNRFASSWILLRHVTLLTPHRITQRNPGPGATPPPRYQNSDIQVSLQPAASNIFRSLAVMFPQNFPQTIRGSVRPLFPNGLVDMATTELAEIRSIVATADTWPGSAAQGQQAAGVNFFDIGSNSDPDGRNAGPDGLTRVYGSGPSGDPFIIARMHAWMNDAFPAHSMGAVPAMTRIRCESAPTNFVGVASSPPAEEAEYRRADQLMLSAHNFLASCTEFIVEWSMGETIPWNSSHPNHVAGREGELIWHGMERRDPLDPSRIIVMPYATTSPEPWRFPIRVPFARVSGARDLRTVPHNPASVNLIHGGLNPGNPNAAVTSHFGWNDPSFDPEDPGRVGGAPSTTQNLVFGPQPNGILDVPSESASPTIAWPWPKLIRITVSLADPNNPSIEQTFQFVFDVPAARAQ
jgi:prepilin-type N-terminal cleavage/methylation domain-containing protein